MVRDLVHSAVKPAIDEIQACRTNNNPLINQLFSESMFSLTYYSKRNLI